MSSMSTQRRANKMTQRDQSENDKVTQRSSVFKITRVERQRSKTRDSAATKGKRSVVETSYVQILVI